MKTQTRKARKIYTKDERKDQILQVLMFWPARKMFSMRQMAFWLNMRPNGYLSAILSELWAEHKIDCIIEIGGINRAKYAWFRPSRPGYTPYRINNFGRIQ